jgi:hypothetical protein
MRALDAEEGKLYEIERALYHLDLAMLISAVKEPELKLARTKCVEVLERLEAETKKKRAW